MSYLVTQSLDGDIPGNFPQTKTWAMFIFKERRTKSLHIHLHFCARFHTCTVYTKSR